MRLLGHGINNGLDDVILIQLFHCVEPVLDVYKNVLGYATVDCLCLLVSEGYVGLYPEFVVPVLLAVLPISNVPVL